MSAIAGIFWRNGHPAERRALDAMSQAMANRGPDGCATRCEGSIALAQGHFWTTPEAHLARQPLVAGELVLTADIRLDNRAELRQQLRLADQPLERLPDSELLLAAYRKWGERCLQYLAGDFAFAIWDARQKRLFCARDQMGVRPFYYYSSPHVFVFASDLRGVLAHPAVPHSLDELRLAYHFFPELLFADQEITFYQAVRRLPPAHTISVTPGQTQSRRYWSLDPQYETRLPSDDAYAEGLRQRFTQAVRTRLHSRGRVASTLSGGLDSSSVACTAREILRQMQALPLDTYSAVFDAVPSADERSFIDAVLAQGGMQPHFTHPDQISPLVDFDRALEQVGEPFYAKNYFIPWSLYQAAQSDGIQVLLDGTDGDTTISHGMDFLYSLLRDGRWSAFAAEAQAITGRYDNPRYASLRGIFHAFGGRQLAQLARQGKLGAFTRGVHLSGPLFGVSRRRLLWQYGVRTWASAPLSLLRKGNGSHPQLPAVIRPQFARRVDLPARLEAAQERRRVLPSHARAQHLSDLQSGALTYSLELMNRMGPMFGLEFRFPFCDLRLVTYALSLPPEQKLQAGWGRVVMRRAMEGILPPKVQWRGGKASLAQVFGHGVQQYALPWLQTALETRSASLETFVDLPAVRQALTRYQDAGDDGDLHWIWLVATLSRWLSSAAVEVD